MEQIIFIIITIIITNLEMEMAIIQLQEAIVYII